MSGPRGVTHIGRPQFVVGTEIRVGYALAGVVGGGWQLVTLSVKVVGEDDLADVLDGAGVLDGDPRVSVHDLVMPPEVAAIVMHGLSTSLGVLRSVEVSDGQAHL